MGRKSKKTKRRAAAATRCESTSISLDVLRAELNAAAGPETNAKLQGYPRCVVCLDGRDNPLPIKTGCACRGASGVAHVECKVVHAHYHGMERGERFHSAWRSCLVCHQPYTGEMEIHLARRAYSLLSPKHGDHQDASGEQLPGAWFYSANSSDRMFEYRLAAAQHLAEALDRQGDHATAELLHREVQTESETEHGSGHPCTLASRCSLATCLAMLGRKEEAEQLYRTVAADQQASLGPRHADTLLTISHLAICLTDRGKCREAGSLCKQHLPAMQQVFGTEHPHCLHMASNLADAQCQQGKHTKAERIYRDVLRIQRRVLGPEHRTTLVTTERLAGCCNNQGKLAEAEQLCRGALSLQITVVGPQHEDTATTAHTLVTLLRNQGKHREAASITADLGLGPDPNPAASVPVIARAVAGDADPPHAANTAMGHSGEWRDTGAKEFFTWCKTKGTLPGHHMCTHTGASGAKVIKRPHWSCCGVTRQGGRCTNKPAVSTLSTAEPASSKAKPRRSRRHRTARPQSADEIAAAQVRADNLWKRWEDVRTTTASGPSWKAAS